MAKKRLALKQFRVGLDKTQDEFAGAANYERSHYAAVEAGKRHGTLEFWTSLQKAWDIPDEKMWGLMKYED